MNKDQLKKNRDSAVSLKLDLDDGDEIKEMFARNNGLFFVTNNKIMQVRSPDDLDPELNHQYAPWEQSIHLPHGSSDPLVARTILQTGKLAEIYFGKNSEKYALLLDISWEVMNSLVSLRMIRERLEKKILEIVEIVKNDPEQYTIGKSPKPLPIVEYYDIEFRSFVNEVRRALSKISELFLVLTPKDIKDGHFHKAKDWAKEEYGEDSILWKMLNNDQRWIETWIAMRIAIEHPNKDNFIETLNFSIEANRTIRLPTWRFVNPKHDMSSPQNLLEVFEICINNILKFFEDLQIILTDGHLPILSNVGIEEISEANRDNNIPFRYKFHMSMD